MNVRLDVPHRDGCNNQLVIIGGDYLTRHRNGLRDVQNRDVNGRRHQHGWTRWLTLICNTIDCPAVVLVKCTDIEQAATSALGERTAP